MESIIVTKLGQIATITLNRPEKRNALNGQLVEEFLRALQQLETDAAIRLLIIQGNGNNFCAGGDVSWMQTMASSPVAEDQKDAGMLAELLFCLHRFSKPTLAFAHGTIMGGGLGLLCACDIVIAADNARFSFSEVKIGVVPSTISPYVIAAIGQRAASYYFLTAAAFDVKEAIRLGIVQQTCPEADLLSNGVSLANEILLNNQAALVSAKRLIHDVVGEPITYDLGMKLARHLSETRRSLDAREGMLAFIEKREPSWRKK